MGRRKCRLLRKGGEKGGEKKGEKKRGGGGLHLTPEKGALNINSFSFELDVYSS